MSTTETKKGGKASPSPPKGANNRGNGIHPAEQKYHYIPIDYIKAVVIGVDIERLKNNSALEFTPVLIGADEVKYEYAIQQNLKLKIYPNGTILFSGSIHKYSNRGEHNFDDFTQSDFTSAISRMELELGIQPVNLRITRLEYGLNITPPILVAEILNGCLQYNRKDIEVRKSSDKAKYHGIASDQYELKLYDKGKQYRLNEDLIRIEKKVTNWSANRSRGIVTLQDWILCDQTIFVNDLIKAWDSIVFYDPTNQCPDQWNKYRNVDFWRELNQKSRTTYKRHRDRLGKFNREYGQGIQDEVSNLIRQKVIELQGVTIPNFSTDRVCPVTKLSIENQRDDSILLSHAGLKELAQKEPQIFLSVKSKYLTRKWSNADTNIQIREIAHNIRNVYYNWSRRQDANQLHLSF
jgi:hypothetical protein